MKRALIGFFVFVLAAWLLFPAGSPAVVPPADARPFIWDQDELWASLETAFLAARNTGCDAAGEGIDNRIEALADDVDWLEAAGDPAPADARFDALENNLFAAALLVAACPGRMSAALDLVNRLRPALKRASRAWDISDSAARDRVYRILYGARMAVEEVLLQHREGEAPYLFIGADVPSATPSVEFASGTSGPSSFRFSIRLPSPA